MLVHIYGLSVDVAPLLALSKMRLKCMGKLTTQFVGIGAAAKLADSLFSAQRSPCRNQER